MASLRWLRMMMVQAKAFEMLIEPGDNVLVENPTYSGSLAALRPLKCNLIGVETDEEGLCPNSLEQILETWPSQSPRPKILYLIPVGSNPTGSSIPLDRKKKIYLLARKFNLLILEDDPYYFLQYSSKRIPSLFSMDVDGRVLRFDSFSKILSSGLRVGFVSGPSPLITQLNLHEQASNLHTSGVTQMMVAKLMQKWKVEGFLHHVSSVGGFYLEKRNSFLSLCDRHLSGLADWSPPTAGMFVWLKLRNILDSNHLIKTKALDKKVLLVPGVAFSPAGPSKASNYVRASFSLATDQEMEVALSRLALLLREANQNDSHKKV
eukprot:TRINITY_DN2548_c0_g1_i2.p1 TRINITY_DN2548_c0_g1~~TRINITY_DN2548_c0_g1_i2.p1  ORF type:complete len:321 (-),score=75.79 TRINITY_DN2548_c0_g1_i2:227-1189(-)